MLQWLTDFLLCLFGILFQIQILLIHVLICCRLLLFVSLVAAGGCRAPSCWDWCSFSLPFECCSGHFEYLIMPCFLLFLLLLPEVLYTATLLDFGVSFYSIWGNFWPVDMHYVGFLFVNIHDIENLYFHSLMDVSTMYS